MHVDIRDELLASREILALVQSFSVRIALQCLSRLILRLSRKFPNVRRW